MRWFAHCGLRPRAAGTVRGTLELVLQAIDRTFLCDEIWLAVCISKWGRGRETDARVKRLCRFLCFGPP
jgi:hypothetical protein